jgi:hypothetical protein
MTIGPDSPQGGGLMKGVDLAGTFSFLRANDLVWNYVVGNYLKGETPPAFDLLYWNSDGTRMARAAHGWYLRNTYVENNLVQPGKVHLKGEALDLGRIHQDIYAVGAEKDHIVPWDAALYQSPENLTPWGFPTSRKCDSMQHVVDSRSGQHVSNRDCAPRSEYFAVAGGGGADG